MTLTADGPHFLLESDSDLADLWAKLMGAGGFGYRTLWLIVVGADGWTLPVIMPNEDLPPRPAERELDALGRVLDAIWPDDRTGSFAALLSRPGPHAKTADDRAWAAAITRVARERQIAMWPVHLATYERIQVMAPDDLIGA